MTEAAVSFAGNSPTTPRSATPTAVDAPKGGEPVAPVAAKVLIQTLVSVDAPELPDALDGQDFSVGQHRIGAALVQPPPSQSSIRQYTVMSSVVASMARPPCAW